MYDASLNWDVDCSNNMHVLLTSHLPRDDPRKFRKDTPNQISKAILRLCNPTTGIVPCSRRIIEDVKRVLSSLRTIVEAGGAVVPGLVNRNGHRNKEGDGVGRRYWPRKNHQLDPTMDDYGIMKEVQEVANEFFENQTETFNRHKANH